MEDTQSKPNFKAFLLILWAIVVCFLGYIFVNEYTLQTGEEVFLETRPVDPRDLLRGDYVILSYTIETDEKVDAFLSKNLLEKWDTFYITLSQDQENLGKVESVSLDQPSTGNLFIKAQIGTTPWWSQNISFGIGKYFVPEWTGRNIEQVRWDMKVLVRIDKYGVAKIVELYYQGEKIDPKTFQL